MHIYLFTYWFTYQHACVRASYVHDHYHRTTAQSNDYCCLICGTFVSIWSIPLKGDAPLRERPDSKVLTAGPRHRQQGFGGLAPPVGGLPLAARVAPGPAARRELGPGEYHAGVRGAREALAVADQGAAHGALAGAEAREQAGLAPLARPAGSRARVLIEGAGARLGLLHLPRAAAREGALGQDAAGSSGSSARLVAVAVGPRRAEAPARSRAVRRGVGLGERQAAADSARPGALDLVGRLRRSLVRWRPGRPGRPGGGRLRAARGLHGAARASPGGAPAGERPLPEEGAGARRRVPREAPAGGVGRAQLLALLLAHRGQELPDRCAAAEVADSRPRVYVPLAGGRQRLRRPPREELLPRTVEL